MPNQARTANGGYEAFSLKLPEDPMTVAAVVIEMGVGRLAPRLPDDDWAISASSRVRCGFRSKPPGAPVHIREGRAAAALLQVRPTAADAAPER